MGQRLLIVDNDQAFLREHRAALEQAFECDFLGTTEGALTRLEGGGYAAALICVEVSENKGYALCSSVRKHALLGEVRVALISAKATEEEYDRHRSLKGRADLYLHKPLLSSHLVAALADLVPPREVHDNPLAGDDLADDWLRGLVTDLELDLEPQHQESLMLDLEPQPQEGLGSRFPIPMGAGESADSFPPVVASAPPSVASLLQGMTQPPPVVSGDAGRIELMEARIQDLEAKLVARNEDLRRRDDQIEDLLRQTGAVTQNLEDLERRREEADLQALQLKAARQEAGNLQETNTRLMAQLEDLQAQATTDHGLGAPGDHGTALQALEDELAMAKADITGLEATLRAQRREMAEQALALEKGERSRHDLEARLQTCEDARTILDAERAETQERLEAVQTELTEAQGRLAGLEADLEAARPLAARLPELEEALAGSQAVHQAAEARVLDLQRELTDREEAVRELHEEGTALRMELDELKHELAREKACHEEALAGVQGELQASRERLGAAEAEARAEAARLQQSLADRETLLAQAAEAREALEDRVQALEADREALDRQVASLGTDLEARDTRLQALEAEQDQRDQRIAALEQELTALHAGSDSLQASLDGAQTRQADLEAALSEMVQRAQAVLSRGDA